MESIKVDNGLREIDPATLQDWISKGKALVVDVREFDEYAARRIESSTLMPLSRFNPHELPEEPGKTTVLVCRSGNRTRDAARQLFAAGIKKVHHLDGGLLRWSDEGMPLEQVKGRSLISVMRQVQIAVGSLVMLTAGLGAFVSPWFLVVTGVIGAGLFVAGAAGTCGMAAVLDRMPWNRVG